VCSSKLATYQQASCRLVSPWQGLGAWPHPACCDVVGSGWYQPGCGPHGFLLRFMSCYISNVMIRHGMMCHVCRRGINLAVDHVVSQLKTRAKMISTTEEISQVSQRQKE
jgi:hypothetical protein